MITMMRRVEFPVCLPNIKICELSVNFIPHMTVNLSSYLNEIQLTPFTDNNVS